MKELVLDLITSYEDRVSTVQELITTAYEATATFEGSFSALEEERERLKTILQQTLAKNCSLRRKDFNCLMERVLSDSKKKRREIEEEQKWMGEKVKEYLAEQKELAISLRRQLLDLGDEKVDTGGLNTVIGNIKTAYQDKGQRLFALLRDFQLHLEGVQREQQEINHKLQRLVDRGESLRVEDLRQLEAVKAQLGRKVERELRRQDVERLLAHFKQQRRESSRHWRQ